MKVDFTRDISVIVQWPTGCTQEYVPPEQVEAYCAEVEAKGGMVVSWCGGKG